MVSRNKIPKEIYRRTGDIVQRTGTDVRDIKVGGKKGRVNRPGDWIPNPKYRPGDLYSGEPPMIRRKKTTTVTKRGPGWEIKKARARTAEQKRKKEAAAEKARKVKEDAAKKARKARKVTTQPKGAAVPVIPVTRKPLAAPTLSTIKRIQREAGDEVATSEDVVRRIKEARQADVGAGKRAIDPDRAKNLIAEQAAMWENKGGRGSTTEIPKPTSAEIVRRRNEQRRLSRKLEEELGPLDDILVDKKGGKLSKSKGGTVKKMRGGKLHNKKTKTTYDNHHGSKLIASLYDLGE